MLIGYNKSKNKIADFKLTLSNPYSIYGSSHFQSKILLYLDCLELDNNIIKLSGK